ncbi:uncharacterized protein LOC111023188 [Momordica charantia]|uniref:RING-type E3 ubiquitin transferase n=1 Tax=Momordica charantia TaxID=3673 RepID=A0A6J1DQ50_MOMCH|nr:uncharacterized protein LOC111023188 [Momordica charantia]
MDIDSQRILEDFTQSTDHVVMDSDQRVDEHGSVQLPTCAFCQRLLVPDNDSTAELEAISICGDCKFLLLEDIETPVRDSYHRTTPRGRRTRDGSTESAGNLFSQEFSHMINLVRQSQASISASSSHMTPDQSRRWRQVDSDSEIDGLDSFDSMFGESESNFSFGPYRHGYGDSDVSYRTYGGDSDASLDGQSFLDTDNFVLPGEGSDVDTDTDIDPMRAGISHWNSSDEDEDRGELTEADTEQDTLEVDSTEARSQLQGFHVSSATRRGHSVDRNERRSSPGYEGSVPGRLRRNRRFYAINDYARTEESELISYVGDSGDYLDRQGFEELLEQIAETTSSRRGAPPAAVCIVKNLPRLVISGEHLKHDSISCAICKDFLLVGVEVNQLPCLHLYHPSCILPWLSARNSCPLCRYELPTDDQDYEKGKPSSNTTAEIHRLQHRVVGPETPGDLNGVGANAESEMGQGEEQSNINSAVNNSNNSGREGSRRRWLFVAAPIVGLVGIALMFWFGNPLCDQRVSGGRFTDRRQLGARIADSSNQRENNRTRRWW